MFGKVEGIDSRHLSVIECKVNSSDDEQKVVRRYNGLWLCLF